MIALQPLGMLESAGRVAGQGGLSLLGGQERGMAFKNFTRINTTYRVI